MWNSRKRKKQPFAFVLLSKMEMGATLIALFGVFQCGRILGLPYVPMSAELFVWLVVFRFLNVSIHEGGHTVMAWVQMAEIREIAVGPFRFVRSAAEPRIRFQWKFSGSNWFGSSVKVVNLNLKKPRLSRVLFAAGGSLANLGTAALLLLVLLLLPGTAFAGVWWIVASNLVLASIMGLFPLIPIGNRDGAQILHTMLWTTQGKELVALDRFALPNEPAEDARGRADFDTVVRIYQHTLNDVRLERTGNPIVLSYGAYLLGFAQLDARNWPAAQAAFDEAVKLNLWGKLSNTITAGSWFGLHKSLVKQNRRSDASAVYFRATSALARCKKDREVEVRYNAGIMLGELHLNEGQVAEALKEAGETRQLACSEKMDALKQAVAHIIEASAQFSAGYTEEGLASARQAEAHLNFGNVPASQRNLGWFKLGELGEILLRHNQHVLGEAYLRDAVGHLEQAGAKAAAELIGVQLRLSAAR